MMLANEESDDRLPIRSGATPAEAVSNGASTGRDWPINVDVVCASIAAASAFSHTGADSQGRNFIAATLGARPAAVNRL